MTDQKILTKKLKEQTKKSPIMKTFIMIQKNQNTWTTVMKRLDAQE